MARSWFQTWLGFDAASILFDYIGKGESARSLS